jgi:hypothetical protein
LPSALADQDQKLLDGMEANGQPLRSAMSTPSGN